MGPYCFVTAKANEAKQTTQKKKQTNKKSFSYTSYRPPAALTDRLALPEQKNAQQGGSKAPSKKKKKNRGYHDGSMRAKYNGMAAGGGGGGGAGNSGSGFSGVSGAKVSVG